LNILSSLYGIAQGVMVMLMPAEQMQAQMEAQNPDFQQQQMPIDLAQMMQGIGVGYVVLFILALILSVVTILGGMKMKNLQSRGLAMTGAVLAMIPCISPCCLIGLPVGIWALVVLNDPDVKAGFDQGGVTKTGYR
jgi:predicted PurR-regulated permease PerM